MLNQHHNKTHTQTHSHALNSWLPEKGMWRGAHSLRGSGQTKSCNFLAMYHSGNGITARRADRSLRVESKVCRLQQIVKYRRCKNPKMPLWLESGLCPTGHRADSGIGSTLSPVFQKGHPGKVAGRDAHRGDARSDGILQEHRHLTAFRCL